MQNQIPMFRLSSLVSRLSTLVCCLVTLTGCGGQSAAPKENVDVSKFVLASEPPGATDVITARKVNDGESVVVFGRIGGSVNPWVEDTAAFTIVDSSLKSCTELGCVDCQKPWDFC